jgi:hypothetical protein
MSSSSPSNRRRARRSQPRRTVRIVCRKGTLGLGQDLVAAVIDLSQTGAGLILRETIPLGQEAQLEILGSAMGRPIKVIADVVWCCADSDGRFRAGLHFRKPLEYSAWQTLTHQETAKSEKKSELPS